VKLGGWFRAFYLAQPEIYPPVNIQKDVEHAPFVDTILLGFPHGLYCCSTSFCLFTSGIYIDHQLSSAISRVVICSNIGGAKAQSSREIIAGFENGAVSRHRVEMLASLCAMCHVHSDIVADSCSHMMQ
jgi:hypothetical protein